MKLTLAQTKAILRATPMEERLDLLTDIYLEASSEFIERFCEGYRWLLSKDYNKRIKERMALAPIRPMPDEVFFEEASNGLDEMEAGAYKLQEES